MAAKGAAVIRLLGWIVASAGAMLAHVGSPDVFFEGMAGPHRIFVAIRPPQVIPGVAEIEIRAASEGVDRVFVTPIPLTGEASKHPPVADEAIRSKQDPAFFTGGLWLMTTGSWQVRVRAEGASGRGEFSVPVPALAQRTRGMEASLATLLAALALVLALGIVSIIGAAVREAQLRPGDQPDSRRLSRARRVALIAAGFVCAVLYLGNRWWISEAAAYDRYVYKPLEMKPVLEGNRLTLSISDPGWLSSRKTDDFIADHGHLVHLFVVRLPHLDRVWHLHPEADGPARFRQELPGMDPGRYQLWADIVHASGFPETMTAELEIAAPVKGRPLEGDDSAGPISGSSTRIVWVRDGKPFPVRQMQLLRFRVEDANGKPVDDAEPYMGMAGHAVFIRKDRAVFAHVHPSGSVPMASLALTKEALADPHAMHRMETKVAPEVVFPYGFPETGEYRVVVQVKRAGRVETAIFDASVVAEAK